MVFKVFVIAALLVAVIARPDGAAHDAEYSFVYKVKDDPSDIYFGHEEARDGDNTEGHYFALLPDGRLQRVDYSVNGDSGFVAEITYGGGHANP